MYFTHGTCWPKHQGCTFGEGVTFTVGGPGWGVGTLYSGFKSYGFHFYFTRTPKKSDLRLKFEQANKTAGGNSIPSCLFKGAQNDGVEIRWKRPALVVGGRGVGSRHLRELLTPTQLKPSVHNHWLVWTGPPIFPISIYLSKNLNNNNILIE